MSLLHLAWIGVRRRALASALTALYVGLGAALALLVTAVQRSTERSFHDVAQGYDLLLVPPGGSGLTGVLSAMYFVDRPAGTLPWEAYEAARRDGRVRTAVPYALGDSYRGHRVVGTTAEHFQVLMDATKRPIGDGVAGRLFTPDAFEVVVGSLAAQDGALALGAEIRIAHGIEQAVHEHAERWKVVGVLRPTGTPQDRAVFVPIGAFYRIEGHEHTAEEHAAEEHEEPGGAHAGEGPLSAVGLRLTSPLQRLPTYMDWRRDGHGAQAVMPFDEVRRLLDDVVGPIQAAFRWTSLLVLVVGALGILVSLYQSLHGRRREIAVLRALGARPRHVFVVILLEATLLCLLGGLLGLLLGHGALAVLAPRALAEYGVRFEAEPGLADLLLLALLAGLGALAGLLPAWRGLRTPVAENLSPLDA